MEIFPLEMPHNINALVKCSMGKKPKPAPREIFLGDWIDFFDLKVIDVAKRAGCTQGYVSNIARGAKDNINVLYLLAISDMMGITVNDLFQRPPSKTMIAQLESYSPRARETILARRQRKG